MKPLTPKEGHMNYLRAAVSEWPTQVEEAFKDPRVASLPDDADLATLTIAFMVAMQGPIAAMVAAAQKLREENDAEHRRLERVVELDCAIAEFEALADVGVIH